MQNGVSLDEPRIRYYETMNNANEVCQERGLLLLQVLFPTLSPNALVTALTRTQLFRQVGTDCGFWVMHYLELEARRLSGEGGGPVTTPKVRKKAMVTQLQRTVRALEKTRQGWLQESLLEEAKRQAAQAVLQAKTTKRQTEEREAAEMRSRAEEAALVSFWCKTLPDAIPGDPKEVRRRLRAEETEELRQEVKTTVRNILAA